jgi:hypothetical protein
VSSKKTPFSGTLTCARTNLSSSLWWVYQEAVTFSMSCNPCVEVFGTTAGLCALAPVKSFIGMNTMKYVTLDKFGEILDFGFSTELSLATFGFRTF